MKRYFIGAAVAAGLVGLATAAYAVPITPSPTIVSGGKTFNNFSCNVVGGIGLTCGQIDVMAHISVNPPDPTNGDPGLRIQAAFNAGAATQDVTIRYDGHVNPGSPLLFHDASMFFNGTVVTSITEDIFNLANGHLIGHLVVSNPPPVFTSNIVLSENAHDIRVVKHIGLNFTAPGPTVISIIDQQFSQTVIPEPATLLLGSGLIGLGWLRRRRRKTS